MAKPMTPEEFRAFYHMTTSPHGVLGVYDDSRGVPMEPPVEEDDGIPVDITKPREDMGPLQPPKFSVNDPRSAAYEAAKPDLGAKGVTGVAGPTGTEEEIKSNLLSEYYHPAHIPKPGASETPTAPPPAPPPAEATDTLKETASAPQGDVIAQLDSSSAPKDLDSVYGKGLDSAALEQAQDRANTGRLIANLMSASDDIGHAIARANTPVDKTFYNNMLKAAEQPVQDIKDRRKAKDEELLRKAKLEQLKEDESGNSPTGHKAEAYRLLLKKFGFLDMASNPNLTPNDIEKVIPSLSKIYDNEQARIAAAKLAEQNLALKKEERSQKRDEKAQNFAKELREESHKGDTYKFHNTAERTYEVIDRFAKNPEKYKNGYSDFATLMLALKTFQGDNSVVRGTEMQMASKAGSLSDQAKNWINRLTNGQSLTNEQVSKVQKVAEVYRQVATEQYLNDISAMITQAEKRDVPLDEVLNKTVLDAYRKRKNQSNPETKTDDLTAEEMSVAKNWAKSHSVSEEEAAQIIRNRKKRAQP